VTDSSSTICGALRVLEIPSKMPELSEPWKSKGPVLEITVEPEHRIRNGNFLAVVALNVSVRKANCIQFSPRVKLLASRQTGRTTRQLVRWTFIRLSHDGIALSCWQRRFDCNTASLHQAMRSIVYVSLFVAWWFPSIGAFRSSLLFQLLGVVSSRVRFVVGRLLSFLIVGIQASGISIPLCLLMLLGWSLIWITSLTLRVYQWGSRSINLTSFQIGKFTDILNKFLKHFKKISVIY